MSRPPTIISFWHLRWRSVFQRPHHLLSRLAQHYRVIVFEEPILTDTDEPYLNTVDIGPNLRVYQPHLRATWPFFSGDRIPEYTALLTEIIQREQLDAYIFWFYTPMALHFARAFSPRAIVYDCMDELSRFRDAPAEIKELETELLARADLVFTGGPSLHQAKQRLHSNVHCFPSSVDATHFRRATMSDQATHPATAALPLPRLGFYGVIDERLDLELIDAVAAARPDWQLVLVGPIVKIAAADLPRRPNLHYPGPAPYGDLPAHLAGWQVALMPFARNEATEFISPTKTLEYMAAGLPIVSTSIRDVAQPYGHVVAIADTPQDFVAACEAALAESDTQRRARFAAYAPILSGTSWDQTAARMRALLETRLAEHALVAAGPSP